MSESDRGRRPSERGVPLVRLQAIRHVRGLSQRRLESLSGVSDSTISEIERFEKRASPETVRRLARGLGVREAQLVGRGGSWLPRLPLESGTLTVRWYERASNTRARLKARAERDGSGEHEEVVVGLSRRLTSSATRPEALGRPGLQEASKRQTLLCAAAVLRAAKEHSWAAERVGLPLEDLLQAGMEAALRRLPTFDPSRGFGVVTYVHLAVRGAMFDEISAAAPFPLPPPLAAWAWRRLAGVDDPDALPKGEYAAASQRTLDRALSAADHTEAAIPLDDKHLESPDERDPFAEIEERMDLERAFRRASLSEREELVVRARLGHTRRSTSGKRIVLEELAEELGVTPPAVLYREKRAVEKLRAANNGG